MDRFVVALDSGVAGCDSVDGLPMAARTWGGRGTGEIFAGTWIAGLVD